MTTLEYFKSQATLDPVQHLESSLRKAKEAIARLPGDRYYDELLSIIHRPGWTTDGEGVYFEAMAELILVYTANLSHLHEQLMDASMAVQINDFSSSQ